MTSKRFAAASVLLASTLGLTACDVAPLKPDYSALTTRLAPSAQVPPAAANATGTIEANLQPQTRLLAWTVSYSGLSGPVTGAHFHGPAQPGESAPVVLPFTGILASPIQGVATLTPEQAADFLGGKWYVNLHTAANPSGEIRAQIPARPASAPRGLFQ